jgi:hypothetical protein
VNPATLKYRSLIIAFVLLLIGLTGYFFLRPIASDRTSVPFSFYCWTNKFSLDSNQNKFLKKYKVEHLRVKLLELSWQEYPGKVIVNNHINPDTYDNYSAEYFLNNKLTPVVFIKNDIFYKIDSAEIRAMAGLVKRALKIHSVDLIFYQENLWQNYWEKMYFSLDIQQDKSDSMNLIYEKFKKNIISYEFDCDWTEKTRDKYFYFLKNIKDTLHNNIESTLRLHQYKYRERMGIPPVDAVNLMCYNMGEFKNIKETNSILNIKVLKEYMKGQKVYPLPMNIALPAFSWLIVFRNNQFYKIIPKGLVHKDSDGFKDSTCCGLEKIGNNKFLVRESYWYTWSEEFLQRGDEIRVEEIEADKLMEVYDFLTDELHLKISELIFFDLTNSSKMEKFDDLAKDINNQ